MPPAVAIRSLVRASATVTDCVPAASKATWNVCVPAWAAVNV